MAGRSHDTVPYLKVGDVEHHVDAVGNQHFMSGSGAGILEYGTMVEFLQMTFLPEECPVGRRCPMKICRDERDYG